ncbi:hypothetical protein E8D34_10205 [Nocardioides sp. GY 10113]|uniref:alkaline phosphatase family protein n=1 Tax=Nocardioides sp. GY 10113 TaxID=2569761 RepID=UPI0010A91836|nr:alkaline phosphatase family protein [Nocardioides sp. GY 10113]TIC87483.1 hypothetical protein E8D34_10205 [Nocardioides sp. GY 10113]
MTLPTSRPTPAPVHLPARLPARRLGGRPRTGRAGTLRRAAALVLAGALGAGAVAGVAAAEPSATPEPAPAATRVAPHGRVLAISLDGLNPTALTRLGRAGTPALHRLLRQGASTLNARAQVEQTVTLPNHSSMVTGRRIDAAHRGHGVTWNSDEPGTTIQESSGVPRISSVFKVVHRAGGGTALFSTKTKFSLFERSWPAAIDRSVIREEEDALLVRALRRDLVRHDRAFTFLHLGLADQTGHREGWMSAAYLDAVRTLDGLVAKVLRTIERRPALASTRIVLTADHGGRPGTGDHGDADVRANYRVPFLVWGPGVDRGDLYAMNTGTRTDPGRGRPGFDGRQPIRNGEVANVATDLLGLRPVPASRWNRQHGLDWTR